MESQQDGTVRSRLQPLKPAERLFTQPGTSLDEETMRQIAHDAAAEGILVRTAEWDAMCATAAESSVSSDVVVQQGRFVDRLSSAERKEYPMCSGFVDYFPDAMALVSHLSWAGNEKHNPGQPLHHNRLRSTDQTDCIVRHLGSRDGSDTITLTDGRVITIPHRVALAWRAMAELQIWAEETYGLDMAPGAKNG